MEFIDLPNLQQKASRIGLGTWSIGGWMWGGTDEKIALETLKKALDMGINLIDTSPVYGFGLAEKIVGTALKAHGSREKILIATKAGLGWKNGKIYRDNRKESLKKELEDSLLRLQVDYIDIYQIHWPDPLTPIEETAQAMLSFLESGKVRALGVSNFSVQQMEEFHKHAPLHTLQPPFNLFERKIEKAELAYCLNKKIATLGYSTLCRGLLTGKMGKDTKFKGDDIRKFDPKYQGERYEEYLHCVERLDAWAQQKYEKSILSLAVRWALDKGISVALCGARKPEQLDELQASTGWNLSADDFEEIDHIINETVKHPVGPEYMAPPQRSQ